MMEIGDIILGVNGKICMADGKIVLYDGNRQPQLDGKNLSDWIQEQGDPLPCYIKVIRERVRIIATWTRHDSSYTISEEKIGEYSYPEGVASASGTPVSFGKPYFYYKSDGTFTDNGDSRFNPVYNGFPRPGQLEPYADWLVHEYKYYYDWGIDAVSEPTIVGFLNDVSADSSSITLNPVIEYETFCPKSYELISSRSDVFDYGSVRTVVLEYIVDFGHCVWPFMFPPSDYIQYNEYGREYNSFYYNLKNYGWATCRAAWYDSYNPITGFHSSENAKKNIRKSGIAAVNYILPIFSKGVATNVLLPSGNSYERIDVDTALPRFGRNNETSYDNRYVVGYSHRMVGDIKYTAIS